MLGFGINGHDAVGNAQPLVNVMGGLGSDPYAFDFEIAHAALVTVSVPGAAHRSEASQELVFLRRVKHLGLFLA
jgi:hypothetical protein